jgi:ATP-dependent RNA helicase DDX51/DBP6
MVQQVRALVVLPVQDLAVQVYHVFLTYAQHTDLKVMLLTGQTSFYKEQQQLVASSQLLQLTLRKRSYPLECGF